MFQSQEDVPGFPETITNDSCHCSHVNPSSTHTILLSRPSRPCCVARPHKSRPRRTRSASENLILASTAARGVPCRHGNTACIPARGVGTDPTRSASLYSGAGSVSGDLGIHGPRLTGAGPHVTGTAEPNLTEFLTPPFERPATARTATSPAESSTSRRTTGSPWPYSNPDTCGRSR